MVRQLKKLALKKRESPLPHAKRCAKTVARPKTNVGGQTKKARPELRFLLRYGPKLTRNRNAIDASLIEFGRLQKEVFPSDNAAWPAMGSR